MRRLIGRFLRNESGATAIEYGLLCALIFLAIVTSISALAATVNKLSAAIQTAIS